MRYYLISILSILFSGGLMAQTGVITGTVEDDANGSALEYATVQVDETPYGALTDSNGAFSISGLEPGLYNVTASYQGYETKTQFEVVVTNSKPAQLEFKMISAEVQLNEVKIVSSPFNKTEESPVSIRTIGVNEIQRNPGGNRDISRVIQSLPGVASTPSFRNDIIIRGGAPNENRFYIDGIEIPTINHFSTQGASGGPVGMINVDFIREVDLYTGAFPANRGNTLSSVMEMKLREGRKDRLGATATIGSSDLGITLEGPIGEKTTFLASARQSYLQFLFKQLGLPFLPTYQDFQFKVKSRIDEKNEITVLGIGAIDDFELNLEADSTDQQRFLLGNLPVNDQWNYTIGAKYRRFTEKGYFTYVLSRSMFNNRAFKYENNDESDPDNLLLDFTSQEIENKARLEYTMRTDGYRINVGVNYGYIKFVNDTYTKISTPFGVQTIDFASKLNFQRYGLFANVSKSFLSDRLSVALGVRMDGNTYSTEMAKPWEQFSPRIAVSYAFAPKWSLNFNTGIYRQLPPYTIMGYENETGDLVNKPNLEYIRSDHLIGGVEYNYSATGKISAEGFYKKYNNYPLLLRDSISLANQGGDFGVVGNEPAASISVGRAYGAEFMIQQKLWKGFFGILTFTYVRAEFTNGDGEYSPSSWDNRQILTTTFGKRFKNNWEIGGKWRYYGGNPYTPFDIDRSSQISYWNIAGTGALDFNQINALRNPATHQLDVRIDKKYFFKKWSINIYLDIQNAYYITPEFAPPLDVVRDDAGNPVVDPNDPTRYQMRFIPDDGGGFILPSLGVIIQI